MFKENPGSCSCPCDVSNTFNVWVNQTEMFEPTISDCGKQVKNKLHALKY